MFDLQLLILQIGVVLAATRILGYAFGRIGQPQVAGEMTAGILLGRIAPGALTYLFPAAGLARSAMIASVSSIVCRSCWADFWRFRSTARSQARKSSRPVSSPLA